MWWHLHTHLAPFLPLDRRCQTCLVQGRFSAPLPYTPTCLVHYNSVWCILSPATLYSANYAILSAEAPPKLPFCYNQTPSQSERVPATPTCHRHSKPQDNLLGSQHMRRLNPKWDLNHVTEKMTFHGNLQFLYLVRKLLFFPLSLTSALFRRLAYSVCEAVSS